MITILIIMILIIILKIILIILMVIINNYLKMGLCNFKLISAKHFINEMYNFKDY